MSSWQVAQSPLTRQAARRGAQPHQAVHVDAAALHFTGHNETEAAPRPRSAAVDIPVAARTPCQGYVKLRKHSRPKCDLSGVWLTKVAGGACNRLRLAAYCNELTRGTSVSHGLLCLRRRMRARDAEADAELASVEPPARRQRRAQASMGRGAGVNGAMPPRQAAQQQAGSEAAIEAMPAAELPAGGLSFLS